MNTIPLIDIHCTSCGAPAVFDIRKGMYCCQYCGGKVTIQEALAEKKGFQSIQKKKMQEMQSRFQLVHGICSGCGADVVFEKNEALSSCAFCGRALVRDAYLKIEDLPELMIPFRITPEEAKERLRAWCRENRRKKEAKALLGHAEELLGFYLPYELVKGPVSCSVERIDGGNSYTCGGCLDEVFVNCSNQLDNSLLDGMEPYDLQDMTEFDFAYLAGQRVKISDVSGKELQNRVAGEVAAAYAPTVRKTLGTKAVTVTANVESMVRLPVLLPVYYYSSGNLMASVNGQTGKVSVRALKESHYYFMPWWLKAIVTTLIIGGIVFAALHLGGLELIASLYVTGALSFVLVIALLTAYGDTYHPKLREKRGYRIFTSGNPNVQERSVIPPLFFEMLDGRWETVVLRFASPLRVLRMVLLALLVLFLPVVVACFLNGFRIHELHLEGSAVWFCIFVPVVPVYVVMAGRIHLYENPWIYIVKEDGRKKRYREKKIDKADVGEFLLMGLHLLICPPLCLAVWFGIASFCVICYLTAFG